MYSVGKELFSGAKQWRWLARRGIGNSLFSDVEQGQRKVLMSNGKAKFGNGKVKFGNGKVKR